MKRGIQVLVGALVVFAASSAALAQASASPPTPQPPPAINPIEMLETASEVVPGLDGQLSSTLNILVLLTVLALAPSILLLCTCFTRIIIVLGLLRQALGTQGLPPTQVLLGLGLFITFVVMAPTLEAMYTNGIKPYADGEVTSYEEAWQRTKQPLRDYMFCRLLCSSASCRHLTSSRSPLSDRTCSRSAAGRRRSSTPTRRRRPSRSRPTRRSSRSSLSCGRRSPG